MNKTYLTLSALLILLIWFTLAKPNLVEKIRPRVIDIMELPLRVVNKSASGLYQLAASQNRYKERIALMEQKIAVLTRTAVQVKELLGENERLRNLLLFKSRLAARTVAAEVIARGQSSWDSFIIIDKGKRDGITSHMLAAKADGLIGRVFEIGENTTKIMLIDNPNSKVGAAVQRTREQGVLIGTGAGSCKLIYLSPDSEIKIGDIVITHAASEVGTLATKGILIGEVVKVLKETHALYISAIVNPSSNLFKVEEVLCIE